MRTVFVILLMSANAALALVPDPLPTPADADQEAVKKVLAEQVLGTPAQLGAEQSGRIRIIVRTQIAAEQPDTLLELGKKSNAIDQDIATNGLTENDALRALVMLETYQVNRIQYHVSSLSPEEEAAEKNIEALRTTVTKQLSTK